jgi:hypothetical protein
MPLVTDVVNECVTVPSPVVGSAKKFAGSGPIIRSCAFVTDTVTSAIVRPGGSPARTAMTHESGEPPAFLTCRNDCASGTNVSLAATAVYAGVTPARLMFCVARSVIGHHSSWRARIGG